MKTKEASAKSQTNKKKSGKKAPTKQSFAAIYEPGCCRHSIFKYTPKRTRQICIICGAKRTIRIRKNRNASVGEWKIP